MSDTLDLAAIKTRAEAASAGPWTAVGDGASGAFYGGEDCYDVVCGAYAVACGGRSEEGGPEVGACERADAEFIAHARADVPALVAEVERLRAVVERTGAALAKPLSGVARVRLARHVLGIDRTAETTR